MQGEFPGIEVYGPAEAPVEGDRASWHLRLRRKCGEIELWQLWHGELAESSCFDKAWCQKLLAERLRTGAQPIPSGSNPLLDAMRKVTR